MPVLLKKSSFFWGMIEPRRHREMAVVEPDVGPKPTLRSERQF
jgi:hypothetical protein